MDSKLIIDNTEVDKNDFYDDIIHFIQVNKQDHIILIKTNRLTDYDFYTFIIEQIDKAYLDARNVYSQQIFNKTYNTLTTEQQEEVNYKIPKNISINEPAK